MTAKESKLLWTLEKEHIKNIVTFPELKTLYDTVDTLIESETLLYDEFVNDLIAEFKAIADNNTETDQDSRRDILKNVFNNLITKYNQRHEEDTNN